MNVVQQAIDKGISERTLDRAKAKIGVQSVRSGLHLELAASTTPRRSRAPAQPSPQPGPLTDIADSHNLFPGGHQ